jgi:glycosyltransferase involved in cell wall biosynthesis
MVLSTPFPPVEGIGYYTYYLSKKLIEEGHEVVVKSLKPEIDVVHFHTPLPSLIKTDLPIITTVHTPMLTDYRLVKMRSMYSILSKISARLVSYPQELKLIQASNIVTTLTNSIANELKEYYLNGKEVIVMGNGVDENVCTPNQKDVEKDRKYILFVGHIYREKGLFDLLESAKYICNDRSDVFFNIVGLGRDLNKLKRKVKKFGLEDRFIFLGQIKKDILVKLYQNATLFVLPSYHEGLPTVLLEAMSCGLPIIATDVRGNRDLISNGKNGIIIPSRDPKKLAEAILMLLEDEKLGENLSKNARKTIEENYTWDIVSSKFLRCYESLVEVRS